MKALNPLPDSGSERASTQPLVSITICRSRCSRVSPRQGADDDGPPYAEDVKRMEPNRIVETPKPAALSAPRKKPSRNRTSHGSLGAAILAHGPNRNANGSTRRTAECNQMQSRPLRSKNHARTRSRMVVMGAQCPLKKREDNIAYDDHGSVSRFPGRGALIRRPGGDLGQGKLSASAVRPRYFSRPKRFSLRLRTEDHHPTGRALLPVPMARATSHVFLTCPVF